MFTVLFNILWTWIFHFPSHGVDTGDGLCRLFLEDMAKCIIHSFSFWGKYFWVLPSSWNAFRFLLILNVFIALILTQLLFQNSNMLLSYFVFQALWLICIILQICWNVRKSLILALGFRFILSRVMQLLWYLSCIE